MWDRLLDVPAWLWLSCLGFAVAIGLWELRERFRRIRARRAEWLRARRDLGYDRAWRTFWFSPRQRKLPPPRRSDQVNLPR